MSNKLNEHNWIPPLTTHRYSQKFQLFAAAYSNALYIAVLDDQYRPEAARRYTYPVGDVPIVVDKMLRAIEAAPRSVNYESSGFRGACKTLGIKHTRKAIFAYLGIEQDK